MEEDCRFSPSTNPKHIDSLLPELLGLIFLCDLSVIDRLHCERVSRRWKCVIGKFGWIKLKALNRETLFDYVSRENADRYYRRFWEGPTEQISSRLVSLFHRVAGPNVVELDFPSLMPTNFSLQPFVPQIAECIQLFPRLEKLNLRMIHFNLNYFVDFLPPTLRDLRYWGLVTLQTQETLSRRCPKLEEVLFHIVENVNYETANAFIGRFQRLKKLDLTMMCVVPSNPILEAISRLSELEQLSFYDYRFEEEYFVAMLMGCTRLQKLSFFDKSPMPEGALAQLAKMPNLVDLEVASDSFTDPFLKAIAQRGKLKRLNVESDELTDDAIVYMLEQCKSFVSLILIRCSKITERSLEAVVAKVERRHGSPPRALPNGPRDNRIFFFGCSHTGIDGEEARAKITGGGNPWLTMHIEGNSNDTRELLDD